MRFTRRELLTAAAGGALVAARGSLGAPGNGRSSMLQRSIPRTGEKLPVIGMGTWQTFDVSGTPDERAKLGEVLRALFDGGGRLIDSSPMYGNAERVVGEVLGELKETPRPFLATKVWTSGREAGIEQMERSMRLMARGAAAKGPFDLLQIHNLLDWKTHLPAIRNWKEQGRLRYWGITHYQLGAFDEMERIVKAEKPDFVQLPYSVGVREAEKRLLPACAESGCAVLVMRPFEGGSLFRDARKKPLPAWAGELDCTSWAQLFLKFILGHPAVTCPIPATSNPAHMADDVKAGLGRLPDEAMRQRIVQAVTA
jgi:diketogulonate reductase-like aldo/keto reductase